CGYDDRHEYRHGADDANERGYRDGFNDGFAQGSDRYCGSTIDTGTDDTGTDDTGTDYTGGCLPGNALIAFTGDDSGEYNIYVMNADGTGSILQVTGMVGTDPVWQPVGCTPTQTTDPITLITPPQTSTQCPPGQHWGVLPVTAGSRPGMYTFQPDQQGCIDD